MDERTDRTDGGRQDEASVHLHVRGTDDDAATRLRERLADVVASGAADVRVHVEGCDDVGLDVLQALAAAAVALRARGRTLLLVGAGAGVRRRLRVHGLDRVLEQDAAVEPYPSDGAGRAARVR